VTAVRAALAQAAFAALAAACAGCTPLQTWTGTLSDSQCRFYHEWDEHSVPTTEAACTLKCVKSGAEFVLLSEGASYSIANQDLPSLAEHAGRNVEIRGRFTDGRISISTVTAR
jgi:hypothetical protein